MAEFSMPFDAVETAPNVYDREYNALEFAEYLGGLVETGVMRGRLNEFTLRNTGDNMQTFMSTGVAYIGIDEAIHYYKNDSELSLTHDTESIGLNRIDRIVLRLDLNTNERQIKAHIKKGVAAANPVAPSLQRDDMVYELSIGQVYIVGGQTYIDSEAITYEVGNRTLCPFATSNILPYIDESLELVKFKTDYGYQTPVIIGDTICIQQASDVQRLMFKLDNVVTGAPLKISLDDGATSVPLKNIDGENMQRLTKGFHEVVFDTDFFTYAPKGGGNLIEGYYGIATLQQGATLINEIIAYDDLYFYGIGYNELRKVRIADFVTVASVTINTNGQVAVDSDFVYASYSDSVKKFNKHTLALVSTSATIAGDNRLHCQGEYLYAFSSTGAIYKIDKNTMLVIATSSAIFKYAGSNSICYAVDDNFIYCYDTNDKISKVDITTLSRVAQSSFTHISFMAIVTDGVNLYTSSYQTFRKLNLDLTISQNIALSGTFPLAQGLCNDEEFICVLVSTVDGITRKIQRYKKETFSLDIESFTFAIGYTRLLSNKGFIYANNGSAVLKFYSSK